MAEIYPFRALHYNSTAVDVQKVVTQPYDKISPEMRDRYYAASPRNFVRLILRQAHRGQRPERLQRGGGGTAELD